MKYLQMVEANSLPAFRSSDGSGERDHVAIPQTVFTDGTLFTPWCFAQAGDMLVYAHHCTDGRITHILALQFTGTRLTEACVLELQDADGAFVNPRYATNRIAYIRTTIEAGKKAEAAAAQETAAAAA
jgi:hypothetical protein